MPYSLSTGARGARAAWSNAKNILSHVFGKERTWAILDHETLTQALDFDVFMDFSISSERTIISAPVEQGAFITYAKTAAPNVITVQLALHDSLTSPLSDRMTTLQTLTDGYTLLDLVTPEKTYTSYNITKYTFRRTVDDGTDTLFCDLTLQEVRQYAEQYSDQKIAPTKKRGLQQGKSAAGTGAKTDKKRTSLLQRIVG